MSSIQNVVENTGSQANSKRLTGSLLPALFSMVLGISLVCAAGFVEKTEVHNAAHDARHSAGFPCH